MARRKKGNEVPFIPIAGVSTFYTTGTANNDVHSTLIAPSDCYISHGTILGTANGTGTDTPTIAYFSAASAGGTQLTTGHRDASGNLYDLDAAAGVVYTADILNAFVLAEGSRFFLNLTFGGGSHTGAGAFGFALFVVL